MPQKIFVASSSEAQHTAEKFIIELQAGLPPDFLVVGWWETEFKNLRTALSTLEEAIRKYDYCIAFSFPDDLTKVRGTRVYQARDNVIFEFGLFLAVLGTDRTFLVRPTGAGVTHRVMSDIGSSAMAALYACTRNSAGFVALPASLKKAADEVSSRISKHHYDRLTHLSTSDAANSRLKTLVQRYRADLGDIKDGDNSNTKIVRAAASFIEQVLEFKSVASGRPVSDAAEDLADYIQWIDDLLNIDQLCKRQKPNFNGHQLTEVWVFADSPLEFAHRTAGAAKKQIPQLKDTIARNLRSKVKYIYFVPHDFDERQVISFFSEQRVGEKYRQNVHMFKFERIAFKGIYTVHKYKTRDPDVYMSAIMEGRNDLLIKLSPEHADGVYKRLEKLKGEGDSSMGFSVRNFVY